MQKSGKVGCVVLLLLFGFVVITGGAAAKENVDGTVYLRYDEKIPGVCEVKYGDTFALGWSADHNEEDFIVKATVYGMQMESWTISPGECIVVVTASQAGQQEVKFDIYKKSTGQWIDDEIVIVNVQGSNSKSAGEYAANTVTYNNKDKISGSCDVPCGKLFTLKMDIDHDSKFYTINADTYGGVYLDRAVRSDDGSLKLFLIAYGPGSVTYRATEKESGIPRGDTTIQIGVFDDCVSHRHPRGY